MSPDETPVDGVEKIRQLLRCSAAAVAGPTGRYLFTTARVYPDCAGTVARRPAAPRGLRGVHTHVYFKRAAFAHMIMCFLRACRSAERGRYVSYRC